METYEIIRSGKRNDGTFWSQVRKTEGDFIMTAFVQTTTEKEAGDEIEVPSSVVKALQWEA